MPRSNIPQSLYAHKCCLKRLNFNFGNRWQVQTPLPHDQLLLVRPREASQYNWFSSYYWKKNSPSCLCALEYSSNQQAISRGPVRAISGGRDIPCSGPNRRSCQGIMRASIARIFLLTFSRRIYKPHATFTPPKRDIYNSNTSMSSMRAMLGLHRYARLVQIGFPPFRWA